MTLGPAEAMGRGPTGTHENQGEKQKNDSAQAESTVAPGESSPPSGSSWLELTWPQVRVCGGSPAPALTGQSGGVEATPLHLGTHHTLARTGVNSV